MIDRWMDGWIVFDVLLSKQMSVKHKIFVKVSLRFVKLINLYIYSN